MNKDGIIKILILHLAVLSVGAVAVAAHRQRKQRRKQKGMLDLRVMPKLVLNDNGRVEELERFSHYVARQLGFDDMSECPQLLKLAEDYLKKKKGYEENMFAFFSKDANAEALYTKLFQELDTCLMGYFAFHWNHAPLVISQVLSTEGETPKKFKNFVLDFTRKQRFERITKNLKVTRLFSTLVEEMKAIGIAPTEYSVSDVMIPAAHKDRSPVLLLMGGGMGAGKSTVLTDILKEPFWVGAGSNGVVVEADAFKETDVIYKAISSFGHHNDMLQTAELVHQSSTNAASSLLVTALNEGRDVIMDGTLSWEPFVQQTIAMARNIHNQRYRMGVGYKVDDDGNLTESYWEPVEDGDEDESIDNGNNGDNEPKSCKPYRIEMVGVVCDAYLAVIRGIRRAVMTGRAVRVKSQLKSHQRFAEAFPRYCELVDNARLYSTNSMGSYKLIGWKDGSSSLLVEPHEISCLEKLKNLNENANSVYELYPQGDTTCGSGSIWNDNVLSPSRNETQKELKEAIKIIENRAS